MKKLICLFVAFVIVVSGTTGYISVSANNDSNNDIKRMIHILDALNILPYSKDEIISDKNVTRAELCSAMAGFMNLKDLNVSETYFEDVTPSVNYSSAVNVLASFGYVSGYEGKFNPGKSADVAASMKILLSILDYQGIADTLGYPDGYIAYGAKLGILKNISQYDVLKRVDLVKILYNALFVRIPKVSYTDSQKTYSIDSYENALQKFFKVSAYEGRMTANTITTLTNAKEVQSNFVKVGGNIYRVDSDIYDDYLGYNVEFYVKDGTDEIVFITGSGDENVIEINLEDIIEYEKSSKRLYYQLEDGKEKKVKIDADADYIVNSTAYAKLDLSKLNKNFGSVKLVDFDSNGSYETVFYDYYYNFVFENYSEYTGIISGKNGGEIDLSKEKIATYSITDLNGENVELSELKAMDVLSVYEDMYEQHYKIILSNNIAAGKLENIYTENDITNLYVNGVWYKSYQDSMLNSLNKKFNVGDQYILYIDHNGYVAYVDEVTVSDMLYGYLIAVTFEKEFGDESNFKLMTQYGNVVKYSCHDKVMFNGSFTDSNGKKYTPKMICTSPVFYKDGDFVPQLIKYQLNSNGKVIKLETVDGNESDENSLKSGVTLTGSDSMWLKAQQSFFFKYILDDDAIIFKVPEQKSGVVDISRMDVTNKEALIASKKYEGVTLYDIDETNVAKVAVISDDAYNIVGNNVFVVEKVVKAITSDKNETIKIEGCYLNEKTSFYVCSDNQKTITQASGLEIGDVITISLNNNNEINNINVLLKANEVKDYVNTSASRGSTNYQTCGIVTKKDGNIVKASLNGLGEDVYRLNSTVNIYIANIGDKMVSVGKITDITEQDVSQKNVEYTFFKLYNDSIYDVVIIKNN